MQSEMLAEQQQHKPKLLDQVRHEVRVRHMARSTEKAYVDWIRRFILFHDKRHPRDMGKLEVSAFLTHLAVERHVASSTQNQALSALLFLYRHVLQQELEWLDDVVRAKRPRRLPVVLTHDEARALIAQLNGTSWLQGKLLYGSGMRVTECLRLRIKDLEFERLQITVREGKGDKDRWTMLPKSLVSPLKEQLSIVRQAHEDAMRDGYGGVELPHALARKYPQAEFELGWQYVFPSSKPSRDPRSGRVRRHHLDRSVVTKAIRKAALRIGINKPIGPHALRHSFATRLLERVTTFGPSKNSSVIRASRRHRSTRTYCEGTLGPFGVRLTNSDGHDTSLSRPTPTITSSATIIAGRLSEWSSF